MCAAHTQLSPARLGSPLCPQDVPNSPISFTSPCPQVCSSWESGTVVRGVHTRFEGLSCRPSSHSCTTHTPPTPATGISYPSSSPRPRWSQSDSSGPDSQLSWRPKRAGGCSVSGPLHLFQLSPQMK